ncbi:MAG: hypothetical protein LBJ74_01435 [Heliobacteriaceae bacterium]|nr:hypothetical protein [Heliobacteriaceae bacterium]
MYEMRDNYCETFLRMHPDDNFAVFVPTLTYNGQKELAERTCGLDANIYNFLKHCANGLSTIEISMNMFMSMEEIAKYFVLCVEQSFIKKPESLEINSMAGFISGKYRVGEYFKHRGTLNVDQLQKALIQYSTQPDDNNKKQFAAVLVWLGDIKEEDIKSVLILKEEAQKRFILDYGAMPKSEVTYACEADKINEEYSKLKDENLQLKRKLMQLLELMKKQNVQQPC